MTRSLPVLAFLAAVFAATSALPAGAPLTVQRTEVEDYKAVFAMVQTLQEVPARARVGGTLTRLTVREGDRVQAGDRLAVVVDPKLAPQLQVLEARIQAQQAQRDQAQIDFQRAEELRRGGVGTQSRLDEARTRLDIAERTLKAARAERDVTGQQSGEGAVLAPGAGRVLRVPVSDGSVVLPGETVALIATDAYVLRLQLPERHAGSLKRGDVILVGSRGLEAEAPEALRQGTVQRVYPQIEQGRVIADVSVAGLGDYFVGERTRVYVSTGKRPAIVVPPEFVYRRSGVSFVRVRDAGEVVVQPGALRAEGLEILSGLQAGDVLVTP